MGKIFEKRSLEGTNSKFILIGAVLCFISFFMVWGQSTSNRFSLSWSRKGTVTIYKDDYGQTIGKQDGTYLSPRAVAGSSQYDVTGGDMPGGSIAYLITIIFIISYFLKININILGLNMFLPFWSFLWMLLVFVLGFLKGGISFGLILYAAGLILLYMGLKSQDIWIPEFVSKLKKGKA